MLSSGSSPYRLHSPAGTAPDWVPPGWTWLGHCQLGDGHVLLHPALGVALLEEAPAWTEQAEAQLRARLEARRFGVIFPGYLPVVHVQVPAGGLAEAMAELPARFAALPPLSLAGGEAWLGMAARALLRGTALPMTERAAADETSVAPDLMLRQEVQPGPMRHTPFTPLPRPAPSPRRPWLIMLGGGVLALAGLGAGMALFSPGPQPATAPPGPPAVAPLPATGGSLPAAAVPTPGTPPAAVMPPPASMPSSAPAEARPGRPAAMAPPAPTPPQPSGGPSASALPLPAPPAPEPPGLPLPPPPPPPPPARAAAAQTEQAQPASPPRRRPARRQRQRRATSPEAR